jgi:ATP-dependent DNA helicase RecG
MRHPRLHPLFAPVTSLPGVGPRLAPLYDRLLATRGHSARVIDLLFHLPVGRIDRVRAPTLAAAPLEIPVTVRVTIDRHMPPPRGKTRLPYRIHVSDPSGDMILVFFHGQGEQLRRVLPEGATRYLSGKILLYDGVRQMTHPERIHTDAAAAAGDAIEPVYALTEGLTNRMLRKSVAAALSRLPDLPEWHSPATVRASDWPSFAAAVRRLHEPTDASPPPDVITDVAARDPVRMRVAGDELLANQLAITLVRAARRAEPGRATIGDGRLRARLTTQLPFRLTEEQEAVIAEITADMAGPDRMLRLLQGDVGAGKTVVALMAMLAAVEAGRQAALMAPTDVLARQHFDRISALLTPLGLAIGYVSGRDTASERRRTLAAIVDGTLHLVVGTHALFQDEVTFRDLALAVVDEQHKFGVHQRLALSRKGEHADLLVMTATPIPRTLVLTHFGDMDVSILRAKPAGRQPIDTRAIALDRLDEVIAALGRAVEAGAQIYWVCPLVDESEGSDLAAATDRQVMLAAVFGPIVGLVHGRLKGVEKDAALAAFVAGETRILVSTTVIEVGVDVPNATIIVIEHAERFGLAQLHQLRGRVGRGSAASRCLLLYQAPLGETAKQRLQTMRETEDGFRIAEADLKLRGEGDVLGEKQSGLPGFRVADPITDADLMAAMRDEARFVLAQDPGLTTPRGQALRLLLQLFERERAVALLSAG